MRFQLTFHRTHGRELPISYQYPLASWIYKVLERADADLSTFLHSQGYRTGERAFKFFCFSQLDVRPFELKGDRLILKGDTLKLQISFLVPEVAGSFVQGLFMAQRGSIGDKQSAIAFEVSKVASLPKPRIGPIAQLKTLSPIVVSRKSPQDRYQQYLHPYDDGYGTLLFQNLIHKWEAHHQRTWDQAPASMMDFKPLGKPSSKLITIKAFTPEQTEIRGYLFPFALTAPHELLEIGLAAGFGVENAMGMGYCEVVGNRMIKDKKKTGGM